MPRKRRLPRRLRAFPSAGLDEWRESRGGPPEGQGAESRIIGAMQAHRGLSDAVRPACRGPSDVLMY
jgi:hypothetical protein